jgi:uncharacterized membrane protein YqjE
MLPAPEGIEEVFPQLKRVGDYARVLFTGVHHRAELAAIELVEARNAAIACGLWWAGAVLLLLLGLATLTAVVAVAFWDSPFRLAALGIMAAGYLGGAAGCLLKLRRQLRTWQPFNETAGQIRKDARCLGELMQRP